MKSVSAIIIASLLLFGCMQSASRNNQSSNVYSKELEYSSIGSDYFVIIAATYKNLGADDVKAEALKPFRFATRTDCDLYLEQNMSTLALEYKELLKRKQEGRKLILLKCGKNKKAKPSDKKYIVFAFLKKGTKTFVLEFKASTFKTKQDCLTYFNAEKSLINNSLEKYIQKEHPDYKLTFIGCESRELFINLENSLRGNNAQTA